MSSRQNTARAMSLVRLASLGLAVALIGGCGGSATSTPAPPPPDTPAGFLTAATVSSNNALGKTLLVFDPAAPNPPRLSIPLSATDNYQTTYMTKVDPATGAYTIIGASNVVYVQNGMTYQVNLRKTSANTPTRISSLSTACSLDDPVSEAMLPVTEAGPDGQCATTGDNRVVYVRIDDAVTAPPLSLPAGVTLVEALPDASYTTALFFLTRDTRGSTPKLTLYSPTLTLVGDVTGGQGVIDFRRASDLRQPGMSNHAYADATLRKLTWSAAGATLSTSLHSFATPLTQGGSGFNSLSDANSFYFTDGLAVYSITGTAAPVLLTTLDAALGSRADISLATADHLLLQQRSSSLANMLSLSKQGGAALTLVTSPLTFALGHAGNTVFYETITRTPSATITAVRRIDMDGSNDTLITDQADSFVMSVLPRVWSLHDMSRYAGFMWCERAAGDSSCSNGSIKLFNTSTGITTTLGQLSHAGTYSSWNPFLASLELPFIDAPFVMRSEGWVQGSTVVENEVYVAQPGVANSLVRVTPGL